MIKERLQDWFSVPTEVIANFRNDRCPRHAAALSFSSMLALAPMLAIALSVLSMFSSFEQFGQSLENFIYRYLVPTAGDDLREYFHQFAGQAGKLTVVGMGFFLLTALLLLFNVEGSFNDIWRIKKGRTLGQRIAVYWALVSLGPILMGASLTVSTYLLSVAVIDDLEFTRQVQSFALLALPFIFEVTAFLLLYLVMPNVKVSLMHAFAGALLAAALFELTKRGFAIYLLNFNNYEVVYGALATLPIFLIWIYLSWMVALVGAELVSVLQQRKLLELT